MNIYLIRHAQSQANVDASKLQIQTNMSIKLTELGKFQAKETGVWLGNYMNINFPNHSVKIWNSPYNRTRQTASIIKEEIKKHKRVYLEEESIYLAERQFGIVDDVKDYHEHYKHESKHYRLHKDFSHDFFARPPLGESPFDMCQRLDFFLKCVIDKNIENHIVVSHGAAIRGLILMHQKQTYEKYNSPNPYNASVHIIEGNNYKGEIFSPSEKSA